MTTSPDLYKIFFNTAGDAIFIIDVETQTVVEANTQAINCTGYQPEEIAGLSVERLFRLPPGMALPFRFQEAYDTTQTRLDGLQLVKRNAEAVEVSINASIIECNQSKILFVIVRELDGVPAQCNSTSATGNITWREEESFPSIIGLSEKIRYICQLIGSVAKSDSTVLIQGESGTGKEIVANAIHAHSLRHRGPFVKVNCVALTEALLESELFGHVKGAFTGAIRDRRGRFKQADGGTILLDEIGSMSLAGQAKLLRVLQEHEFEPVGSSATTAVNVRVIAATNADLKKAVTESKFREDLYYRLHVFSISLPPLRERKDDISMLAQHFLHKYNLAVGKKIQAFTSETLTAMVQYDWPGNVRELENTVEHAVLVEKSLAISPASLPMNLTPKDASESSTELGLRDMLNLFEKQVILDTLMRANWIKKRAADMLRIDARNLPYLLRKHNLSDGLRPN
jgi:PAS domain S-box-containing protein